MQFNIFITADKNLRVTPGLVAQRGIIRRRRTAGERRLKTCLKSAQESQTQQNTKANL